MLFSSDILKKGLFEKYIKSFNDISYYIYPFPTGKFYIFGDDSSIKLVLFGYKVAANLKIVQGIRNSITKEIGIAVEFIDHYLLGQKGLEPNLDMSIYTENEKVILEKLKGIPFSEKISYIDLARISGFENGARFAGNVMAKNLFPIFIPCHRVIRSNGNIGNYSAGKAIKRFLLNHELAVSKI